MGESGGVGGAAPPSGAEVLEAPKKNFGLNQLALKAPEEIFDRPKVRRKIWPNMLSGGGVAGWVGGWVQREGGGEWVVWDPAPPPEVLRCKKKSPGANMPLLFRGLSVCTLSVNVCLRVTF